jgi:DNA repair protein RecN (Recombination protein N)
VLCVTHLPQVAAKGHHHLQVSKTQSKTETKVKVSTLTAPEKVKELARMLGGLKITAQTLAHAKEMLGTD